MRTFLLEVWEGLRIALRAIWVNKLRAVLTTLGIIIGIASVTAMATVLNGIDRQFETTLSQLGTDVLYIDKWLWGGGPNFKWWEYVNRPPIQEELAEAVRTRSRYAEAVAPQAETGRRATYRENDIEGANVTGSTPEYGRIQNVELAQGRFFTESDERAARGVCVIGAEVAEELFLVGTPLGKEIRVGGKPCRVIGVQKRHGAGLFGENNVDTSVIMPFSTFKKFYGISRWRSITLMVQVGSPEEMERAKDELTGILRAARQIGPTEERDFEINDQSQIRESFEPVKFAIYGVGIFLTSLALLVGGIGVMNIMYVSVKERTREIGIRKAVGAKRRTILLQFLIEAVIVCLIGGVIGVGLSFALASLINALGVEAVLPWSTVGLAFGICVLVGLIFGLAPARQAAKAEPIEALRYE